MAEVASEDLQSGGFHNMVSLKGLYFARVEDVPEYVQQVSFCSSPRRLQTLKRVLLQRADADTLALSVAFFYHQTFRVAVVNSIKHGQNTLNLFPRSF